MEKIKKGIETMDEEFVKDLAVEQISYCCKTGILERTMDDFFDFAKVPEHLRSVELYTEVLNQAEMYWNALTF